MPRFVTVIAHKRNAISRSKQVGVQGAHRSPVEGTLNHCNDTAPPLTGLALS